jgi:DNA polymerase-1
MATRRRKKRYTLLIDADILIHRASVLCEREICWDEEQEIWSLHADLKEAKDSLEREICGLEETLGGARTILALSSRKTFRHKIYPRYKASRKKGRKPVVFGPLRAWAKTKWENVEFPALEADDVLGVLATSRSVPAPKIVVSDDKDLETIPCRLYKPGKPELGVQKITYADARRRHLEMTLTGDSTDGIPGLSGCGPKGAEKVLQEGLWEEVVQAFEAKGLNEDEAVLQARLVKILTPTLFDLQTNEVTLWDPKKHK